MPLLPAHLWSTTLQSSEVCSGHVITVRALRAPTAVRVHWVQKAAPGLRSSQAQPLKAHPRAVQQGLHTPCLNSNVLPHTSHDFLRASSFLAYNFGCSSLKHALQ